MSANHPRHASRSAHIAAVLALAASLLSSLLVGTAQGVPPVREPDPKVLTWEHFCNGGTTQCAGGDWVTGNLGQANSAYEEGDSVPHRLLLDPDGATGPITVVFTYDASRKHGSTGAVAHDYLTSWDLSEGGLLDDTDLPISPGAIDDTVTIPLDPSILLPSPDWVGPALADGDRVMQAQNATFAVVDPILVTTDGNFGTSTHSTSTVTVIVTPISAADPIGLVFGAHVSNPDTWTLATASALSGSPYHVTVEEPSGGGDLSMSSGAITGVPIVDAMKQLADDQPTTVSAGDTVTYEIVVSNEGAQQAPKDSVAGTPDVTDTISGTGVDVAEITSMSYADVVCDIDPGGDSGTCTAVPVGGGASQTVTVVVTIDDVIASCDDLTLDNVVSSTLDGDGPANNTVTITIEGADCSEPEVGVEKYILANDGETWLDADEQGSGPTLILPATAEFKVEVTNTGNVELFGVEVLDHVDPELDQGNAPFDADRLLDITSTCLQDFGTDDQLPFDQVLAPDETITCFFDDEAAEGAHFDVVEVTACWPEAACIELSEEPPGQDALFESSATRPLGAPTAGLVQRVGFAVPVLPTLVSGFDPAHYLGALATAPPTTVLVADVPSIDLAKQGSTSTAAIGSTVTYVYTITNNGNTTVTDVELVDVVQAGSGNQTLVLADAGDGFTLPPGASATFNSSHTVTSADLGQIVNVATATALAGGVQLADIADWTVQVVGQPSITIDKSADQTSVTYTDSLPDSAVVTYTYVVTNSGDLPLVDVTVSDDVLGAITLATTTLAPGASTIGTATHVVSRADADAGVIVNTATATGVVSTGEAVQDVDTVEVVVSEVLGEVLEAPDPAPVAEPAPEVLPEVLTTTGTDAHTTFATAMFLLTLGLFLLHGPRRSRARA